MEILSRLLEQRFNNGNIRFHPKAMALQITHLSFADDIMIFYDGSSSSLSGIRDALHDFSTWSGLSVNNDKTTLYIAGVDEQDMRASINCGFNQGHLPVRYLGLPLLYRRLKASEYEPLLDRIAVKLRSWSSKTLSFAGRAHLIKSVIAGIVVFWMSAFIIPSCCLRKIEALCSHYLWSGDPDHARGGKIGWSTVCLPRKEGGLGLRRFGEWNKALVLRRIWSLFEDSSSLWVSWHMKHNLRNRSFWEVGESQSQSWCWKSLLRLRPLARRFITCVVGNGRDISFWHDNWSPFGPLINYMGSGGPRRLRVPISAKVAQAFSAGCWPSIGRRTDRESHLLTYLASVSFSPSCGVKDVYSWVAAGVSSVFFSSSRTWEEIRARNGEQSWEEVVWYKGAIPAHAFHFWVTQWDRLPTMSRISKWSPAHSPLCVTCSGNDETRDHLFFTCILARDLWQHVCRRLNHPRLRLNSWSDLILWLLSLRDKVRKRLSRLVAQATVYRLWWHRNRVLHDRTRTGPQVLFQMIDKEIRAAIAGRRSRKGWCRMMGLWLSTRL